MKKSSNKKNLINILNNNNGSVMVTVLIVFLFVSVLVAIILSSVVVNFRIRAVERNVKDEFYYAEKALNDIYTGIGLECSEIMGDKYNKVLENVGGTYTSYNIENEKEAMARFNLLFAKEIQERFKDDAIETKLSGYIVGDRAELYSVPTVEFHIQQSDKTVIVKGINDLNPSDPGHSTYYRNLKYTVIKGVTVKSCEDSDDNTGYVSAIRTDIVIETPRLDFVTVNKKWFDYAVIANDGIEFKGNTSIKGNTYGGSLTTNEIKTDAEAANISGNSKNYSSEEYGGLFVNNSKVNIAGDYIISGGDIIVKGTNADLELGYPNKSQSEVWFESLVAKSGGKATLRNGTLAYALNDTKIEENSENSKITIKGSYFGYNPGKFDMRGVGYDGFSTKEGTYKQYISGNTNPESSKSSAIIVNANNSIVDMSKIDTLVLLGNAYVDHSSKSPTYNVANGSIKDAYTLESAALKANQEIYLVPTEFLNTTNPRKIETPDAFTVDTVGLLDWAKDNFGDNCLNASQPYNTIIESDGSSQFAYCYLNFSEDEDNTGRMNYVRKIIAAIESPDNDPIVNAQAKKIESSSGLQKSEIIIGDGTATDDTHVFANSAIIEYRNNKLSVKGDLKGIDRFKGYSLNMYHKYRWLDTYLDPQVTRSLTEINKPYTLQEGETTDGGKSVITMNTPFENVDDSDFDNTDLPLSRLVWLGDASNPNPNAGPLGISTGGVRYIKNNDGTPLDSITYKSDDLPGKVIISNKSTTLISNSDVPSDKKLFVIASGDVEVEAGVKINGFIYSGGKITFLNSGSITETTEITFDSALFEQRIEQEIKIVKEDIRNPLTRSKAYKNYYLISYLLDIEPNVAGIGASTDNPNPATDLKYYYGSSTGATTAAAINTDYRNFISFENWKNGQIPE